MPKGSCECEKFSSALNFSQSEILIQKVEFSHTEIFTNINSLTIIYLKTTRLGKIALEKNIRRTSLERKRQLNEKRKKIFDSQNV
jgi:hypothetical protein